MSANDDNYNLGEMSEEQKDALIMSLARQYNTMSAVSVSLHNSLETLAAHLLEADTFGSRSAGIRTTATRMRIIASIARAAMGIDEEQIALNAEFEDLISRMDDE